MGTHRSSSAPGPALEQCPGTSWVLQLPLLMLVERPVSRVSTSAGFGAGTFIDGSCAVCTRQSALTACVRDLLGEWHSPFLFSAWCSPKRRVATHSMLSFCGMCEFRGTLLQKSTRRRRSLSPRGSWSSLIVATTMTLLQRSHLRRPLLPCDILIVVAVGY